MLATKTNGTLWAWGQNGSGQLGIGNLVAASSPVQVGALSTWVSIYSEMEVSYAIKNDGTLWTWGYNAAGELGVGTLGNLSSPVQIGTANNWVSVSPSFAHAIALKSDSTIWGWGENGKGQLGNGTTAPAVVSTPIQIGSSTSWLPTGAVGSTSFGIRLK